MPDAIRGAILCLPVATRCRVSKLARSQSTGVEPSRARDATRHIDRWLVHLVGWIYHIETYKSFVFGLALILFGAVIAATGGFRARLGTSWRSPASVT
jgi:hypothetical protein